MFDKRFYYPDGMVRTDSDGRAIVKIASDNNDGWRYGYQDEIVAFGYTEYVEPEAGGTVTILPVGNVTVSTGNVSGNQTGGWGNNS